MVESRHRVHTARVDADGRVVEAHGDAGLVTFMRSAAKPIQALLLVRAYDDLAEEDVAIACASHGARAEQLAAVRELLARAGATEDDLECGAVDGSRLNHNCSGKHAGFLCVCAAQGWPFDDYRLRQHPLQVQVLVALDDAANLGGGQVPIAVDGCGVVTVGLSLEQMAVAFGRLVRAELEGADCVTAAMKAHPDLRAEIVIGTRIPQDAVMERLEELRAKQLYHEVGSLGVSPARMSVSKQPIADLMSAHSVDRVRKGSQLYVHISKSS